MVKRLFPAVLFALGLTAVISVQPANGSTAISFDDVSSVSTAHYCMGYEFTPSVNILVTHLGFYDYNDDGIGDNHPVGIFRTSDSVLITSLTVLTTDPASGNSPNGYFHYQALGTPVTLTGGTTYRIAAVTLGFDPWPYNGFTNLSSDPLITLGNGYYVTGSSLVMPTNSAPPEFYATSNFLFEVPEPASLVLLIAGGTLMLQRQRKSV